MDGKSSIDNAYLSLATIAAPYPEPLETVDSFLQIFRNALQSWIYKTMRHSVECKLALHIHPNFKRDTVFGNSSPL